MNLSEVGFLRNEKIIVNRVFPSSEIFSYFSNVNSFS